MYYIITLLLFTLLALMLALVTRVLSRLEKRTGGLELSLADLKTNINWAKKFSKEARDLGRKVGGRFDKIEKKLNKR